MYYGIGLLWGIYAAHKQYNRRGPRYKIIICFGINCVFWPIGVVVAIVKCLGERV